MKTIYLMRHAKSDWDADYSGDFNRPLNNRGKSSATKMGAHLVDFMSAPDLVLCSSSLRTRQTYTLLSAAANWESDIEFDDELYLSTPMYVFERLQNLDQALNNVLVIGHQPTTGIVASSLIGGKLVDVPTATFIEIEHNSDNWSDVGIGTGQLSRHILARSLD